MLKKLLVLLTALCLCVCLVACNDDSETDEDPSVETVTRPGIDLPMVDVFPE